MIVENADGTTSGGESFSGTCVHCGMELVRRLGNETWRGQFLVAPKVFYVGSNRYVCCDVDHKTVSQKQLHEPILFDVPNILAGLSLIVQETSD
jgi:hypothetical protein